MILEVLEGEAIGYTGLRCPAKYFAVSIPITSAGDIGCRVTLYVK